MLGNGLALVGALLSDLFTTDPTLGDALRTAVAALKACSHPVSPYPR